MDRVSSVDRRMKMTPTPYGAYSDVAETRQAVDKINDDMRNAVMPVTLFVGIEMVLGFVGNLLVLYVFWFRYHKCNFRYFVIYLALTDLTSTVTTLPGEIVAQLLWYVYPLPSVCIMKAFFNVLTVSSEALCLMTIAVDRWRKICHPHKWHIKQHVAKWLWVGIYGAASLTAIPVFFLWGTHDERLLIYDTYVTVSVCEIEATYVYTYAQLGYISFFSGLLGILMLSMFVLYILVARELIQGPKRNLYRNMLAFSSPTNDPATRVTSPSDIDAGKDGGDHCGPLAREATSRNSHTSGMRRKTLMMATLTLIFINTTVLYTILLWLIAFGSLTIMTDTERAAYFFFFRLYFINHMIKPFVYLCFDSTFQETVTQCKKPGNDGRSNSNLSLLQYSSVAKEH